MRETLGDLLHRWVERADLSRGIRSAFVVSRWPDVVGPMVSRHTAAESLKRGVLTVRVDSGVWASELSAHEPSLLERLNEGLDEPFVTSLKFVAGVRWAPPASPGPEGQEEDLRRAWPRRHDLKAVELSDDEKEMVERLATAAGDDLELGRAGARWLATTLRARRWFYQAPDNGRP